MGVLRLLLTLILSLAGASASASPENELKAAFVVKFAAFATWPADASHDAKSFVIGVGGSSEIAADIERAVAGTKVHNRPVAIRKVNSAAEAAACQMLYIPAGANGSLLSAVRNLPVLTVGDTERFNADGGIIELKKVGTKLRFTINKSAASKARIELSAQLLKLSTSEK